MWWSRKLSQGSQELEIYQFSEFSPYSFYSVNKPPLNNAVCMYMDLERLVIVSKIATILLDGLLCYFFLRMFCFLSIGEKRKRIKTGLYFKRKCSLCFSSPTTTSNLGLFLVSKMLWRFCWFRYDGWSHSVWCFLVWKCNFEDDILVLFIVAFWSFYCILRAYLST